MEDHMHVHSERVFTVKVASLPKTRAKLVKYQATINELRANCYTQINTSCASLLRILVTDTLISNIDIQSVKNSNASQQCL